MKGILLEARVGLREPNLNELHWDHNREELILPQSLKGQTEGTWIMKSWSKRRKSLLKSHCWTMERKRGQNKYLYFSLFPSNLPSYWAAQFFRPKHEGKRVNVCVFMGVKAGQQRVASECGRKGGEQTGQVQWSKSKYVRTSWIHSMITGTT